MTLDDIKNKAKSIISNPEPFITRQTNTYDSSKNRVIVAGLVLDGVVECIVNADILTTQQQGIDYYYTAITQSYEQRTLTVNLLPTASCLNNLRLLALKQINTQGWFNIAIHENDRIVDVFRAWVISLPEINMSKEAEDRVVVFGIKTMSPSRVAIDQPTDFEKSYYKKYNAVANSDGRGKYVDEASGELVTFPYP